MNAQKQHRNDNLQKSSVLFLQLGLVLALFFVYTALEFESVKAQFPFAQNTSSTDDDVITSYPIPPITNRQPEEPPKPAAKKQVLTEIITKPDDEPDFNTAIEPTDTEQEPTEISDKIDILPDGNTLDEEPDEHIAFIAVENAPVFPGCEGLTKEASKACFSKEVSKFINKKFNTTIAETLPTRGKQKIWVEFIVDRTGTVVNIRARALHESLEKEAIRVVKKLPQMIPAKQRAESVSVKYMLPISFQIY